MRYDSPSSPQHPARDALHAELMAQLERNRARLRIVKRLTWGCALLAILGLVLWIPAWQQQLNPKLTLVSTTPDGRTMCVANTVDALTGAQTFRVALRQSDSLTIWSQERSGTIAGLEFMSGDTCALFAPGTTLRLSLPPTDATEWLETTIDSVLPAPSPSSTRVGLAADGVISSAWVRDTAIGYRLGNPAGDDASANAAFEAIGNQWVNLTSLPRPPSMHGYFRSQDWYHMPLWLVNPESLGGKEVQLYSLYCASFKAAREPGPERRAFAGLRDLVDPAGSILPADESNKPTEASKPTDSSSDDAASAGTDTNAESTAPESTAPEASAPDAAGDASGENPAPAAALIERFVMHDLTLDKLSQNSWHSLVIADGVDVVSLIQAKEDSPWLARIWQPEGSWSAPITINKLSPTSALRALPGHNRLALHAGELYDFELKDGSTVVAHTTPLRGDNAGNWRESFTWTVTPGISPVPTEVLQLVVLFSFCMTLIGIAWLVLNREHDVEVSLRELLDKGSITGAKPSGGQQSASREAKLIDPEVCAGPGRRGMAFLIDYMLFLPLLYMVADRADYNIDQMLLPLFKQPDTLLQDFTPQLLAMAAYAVYGFGCEAWFGCTIGKRVMNIRVKDMKGQRPSLWRVLVRNLLRAIEFSHSLLLLASVMTAVFSSRKQRPGDMLAGTVAHHDPESFAIDDDSDGQSEKPKRKRKK